MKIGKEGLSLITHFEGYGARPYNDPVGHCTVGYGHLIHHGKCTKADKEKWGYLTKSQAVFLLRSDLDNYEYAVNNFINVKLTQNQFDALVSFTYNVGTNALRTSTLREKLNNKEYKAVPNELKKWNKAGGHVVEGLTRRRKAEADLWNKSNKMGSKERAWRRSLRIAYARRKRVGFPKWLQQRVKKLKSLIKRERIKRGG